MAIRLDIVDLRDPGRERVRSFVQDRVVIGRARSCDVCLPDMTVSTRHAEIRLEGNEYRVVDLGSRNGTTAGGARLVPHRPRRLVNGEVLGVAGFDLRFRLGIAPGPPEARDESAVQARAILADLLARTGEVRRPALLVVGGPGPAGRFPLPDPPASLRVGRAAEAEIRLEDRDVSKLHAEIARDGDGVSVRDLGSHGGVLVGGQRVGEARLEPGQAFSVGSTTFALEYPVDEALAAIQGAPEEDTATFSAARAPAPEDGCGGGAAQRPAERVSGEPPGAPSGALPTGPADPLVPAAAEEPRRITHEMPRPAPRPGAGDVGLIAVGAILLVAAVVALALLLT